MWIFWKKPPYLQHLLTNEPFISILRNILLTESNGQNNSLWWIFHLRTALNRICAYFLDYFFYIVELNWIYRFYSSKSSFHCFQNILMLYHRPLFSSGRYTFNEIETIFLLDRWTVAIGVQTERILITCYSYSNLAYHSKYWTL